MINFECSSTAHPCFCPDQTFHHFRLSPNSIASGNVALESRSNDQSRTGPNTEIHPFNSEKRFSTESVLRYEAYTVVSDANRSSMFTEQGWTTGSTIEAFYNVMKVKSTNDSARLPTETCRSAGNALISTRNIPNISGIV